MKHGAHSLQLTRCNQHTLALMRRDSVSEIGRKLSIIRPGATTDVAAYLLVGSMTTKGQMTPTSRVSMTASQAGENGGGTWSTFASADS